MKETKFLINCPVQLNISRYPLVTTLFLYNYISTWVGNWNYRRSALSTESYCLNEYIEPHMFNLCHQIYMYIYIYIRIPVKIADARENGDRSFQLIEW